ncbi:MAG: carbohydrate ABC transporter permease, partial [Gaiellaceae bacterium]
PLVVLVIPLFVIMRNADLLGTYVGLIVVYLAFTVPLAVWVMRGFLVGIPEQLEHAARTDGATWRVTLPLAAPASPPRRWLEGFMLALTFMNDETRKPLPVVIQSFVGRGDTDWGAIMAAGVLYTLPVAVVFILPSSSSCAGT